MSQLTNLVCAAQKWTKTQQLVHPRASTGGAISNFTSVFIHGPMGDTAL